MQRVYIYIYNIEAHPRTPSHQFPVLHVLYTLQQQTLLYYVESRLGVGEGEGERERERVRAESGARGRVMITSADVCMYVCMYVYIL